MLKIGHRGAKAYSPENTLPSFMLAVGMGVDMVEVDVRITKDKYPVAIHDNRLKRLTKVADKVSNMNLAQLKRLKIFKTQPIPTLGEVLEVLDNKVGINIEMKVKGAAQIVIQTLRDYNTDMRNVMLSSNYPSEIQIIEKIEPRIRTALLLRSPNSLTFWMFLDALAFMLFPITKYYILWIAKHSGADYLNIHHWFLTKRKVAFLKKHGIKTCAWTVDSPRAIARLKALKVDGIFTNYPDRLN